MNPQLIMALTALVSMISSAVGVFIGMKVGLAKLETWQGFATKEINEAREDVSILKDDSLIHDMEIETLMRKQGMERFRRQAAR